MTATEKKTIKSCSPLKIYLYFRSILFFLIFSLSVFGPVFAASQNNNSQQSTGFKKLLKNYSPKDFNQLWSNLTIHQDKQGIIYANNLDYTDMRGGLQEFDGVSWRIIKGLKRELNSMAVDDTGTIYIGGHNEIGFLIPDENGSLQYQSLIGQLEDDKKNFGYVRFTHATKKGIYFNSWELLFRWNPNSGKIKVWKPKGNDKFLSSFQCNGEFFIHRENVGLMRMEKDELKVVPGGKIFKEKRVSMMAPFDAQTLLIGTRTKGLYLFDGSNSSPFPTKVDDYLIEKQLSHGTRLSSGDFALATAYGGLVIIDSHGRLKETFNKSCGLQDNEVHYIFEDLQGNLWLALEHGISKIEYASPISINSNLNLNLFSIVKHRNVLYVGTERGLYYLASEGKFRHVPQTSGYYFSLLSIDDSIFAATSKGIYLVENQNSIKISGGFFISLLQSQINPNRIWGGAREGLFSLYKQNGQWVKEHQFKKITQRIEKIIEDKKGNLWLGLNLGMSPNKKIVLKVDFPGDGTISSPLVSGYNITSQLLSHKVCWVFWAAGHAMFSTKKGLFRFDEKKKVFIPDLTLGNEFAGGTKVKGLIWLREDKNKNIWLHSKTRVHMAKPQTDGSYVVHSKPFQRLQSYYWFPVYPDPDDDITWIGGKGSLIRYDNTIKKNYQYDFPTLVRRILANGNLVFGGYKMDRANDSNSKTSSLLINYMDRHLSFEFAAPFFEDEAKTRYRYLLEGYDDDWSAWSSETKKEYNTLDSGQYQFRVQAKNVYGHLSREAAFPFKILLPWYRTWWAFLSYVLVLFMLTYLIVKWRRSLQLEQEKQKLEQIVSERTKEIKVKNRQLEDQSEKLREMDKVKSRFFTNISHEFRTPLTLIIGSLEQVLSLFHNKDLEKKINLALQNSHRLLGLINQLLDLSKLDSGRMKLQACQQNIAPFLKGIMAAFEPAIDNKGLDLTLKIEAENKTLYFDPEKLEEVILNLLANAVKFTPPGGKIMISVTENPAAETNFPSGSLEISVCDTGPGIPRHQLAHIFDRFYQSDSTYENHPKGSGIGLALAIELVELHHGKLAAHSSEGKGTEFVIRLPLGDSHLKAEEIVRQMEKTYKHKNLDKIPTPFKMEKEPSLPVEVKNETTDRRETDSRTIEEDFHPLKPGKDIILVVEDSADLRDYIRGCLEPHYEVIEAKNGREGIQKAQESIPDLIISDIMMPEADGYELSRELKNHIETSHIPIILLTAKASEENIVKGLEIGIDDYITKPFSTKILSARIKNLIDLRLQLQLKRKKQMTLQPTEISLSSVDEDFYQELQVVIEKNLSDSDFNVEQLGKKLYLSRSTLYRKIMALTGEPPRQFIRSYRLKRAAQLLKAKFGNVTEVAVEVGFSNIPYFTKCFKEEFHQLPSAYQTSETES